MVDIVALIETLLPESVLATKFETEKGLLFAPNDNLRIGPRYLIRLNSPLEPSVIDWKMVSPFFNDANENICREFFRTCNGFSIGRQFTAWGILTDNAYTGNLLTALNVPFDLGGNGYGSYPVHAPNAGYFIGHLREDHEETEWTDIVLPDGTIISGEFRKKSDVVETFPDVFSWIGNRVPRALKSMQQMGELDLS